ncbi:MAG: hypothetical protein NTX97_11645 [Bacteroidetes bacterium]|nr:hypothetical protein [Bacteroidota bacterium]
MDKSAYKIIRTSADLEEETTYWFDKTPQERLEAIEHLRQQYILFKNLSNKLDKTFFAINYGK